MVLLQLFLDSRNDCVDSIGCFGLKPIVTECKQSREALPVEVRQSLCVVIVEDWIKRRALFKARCELLRGVPFSKLNGDPSPLRKWPCAPCARLTETIYRRKRTIRILNCILSYAASRSTYVAVYHLCSEIFDRHRGQIWLLTSKCILLLCN